MNNRENMMNFIREFTAKNADKPVTMPFGEVVDGMQKYYEVMGITIDLINLIREETALKKHHRAYLHVREELENTADAAMDFIRKQLSEATFCVDVECDDFPFAVVDEDDDEDGLVVVKKTDYDTMIDDILTLAELVTMVTEMRTGDLNEIKRYGKLVPAFAAFERNRLSVYKDARFEADQIIDRLEEMDEPCEVYSD